MGRRTLLLIAALVVAALGTVLVFLYAQNAQNAAQEGQSLVKVLVAKTKIDVNTTGAAASANGAFEQQDVPKSSVVPGALSDATPLAGLVALVPIFPGQQIISAQWGAAAQTSGLPLPPGDVAISVQLGDTQRVAGFVSPGSNVAIFVSGTIKPPAGSTAAATPVVRTLFASVQVLAVGPTTTVSKSSGTASGNTEAVPTAILTLAVTQEQAKKILYVTSAPGSAYGGMTFALLDKNSKVVTPDKPTTEQNLFN
jgi:pilus assembly protein CpaB